MTPPGNVQEARRKMDDVIANTLIGRLDKQDEQIAELTRTLRGFNGTQGVLQRLERIVASQETASEDLKKHEQVLDEILKVCRLNQCGVPYREPITAPVPAPKSSDAPDDKPVSFNQLAGRLFNDIGKPILIAVFLYLMLTLFPNVLVHLGPK